MWKARLRELALCLFVVGLFLDACNTAVIAAACSTSEVTFDVAYGSPEDGCCQYPSIAGAICDPLADTTERSRMALAGCESFVEAFPVNVMIGEGLLHHERRDDMWRACEAFCNLNPECILWTVQPSRQLQGSWQPTLCLAIDDLLGCSEPLCSASGAVSGQLDCGNNTISTAALIESLALSDMSSSAGAGADDEATYCDMQQAEIPTLGCTVENNQVIQADGCTYPLWESSQVAECLDGGWVAISGGSNSLLWFTHMVNQISPGTVHAITTDATVGGSNFIDVVIDANGQVVHHHHEYYGTAEQMEQSVALEFWDTSLQRAPAFSPGMTRFTHFMSQYWEHANASIGALKRDSNWDGSRLGVVFQVTQWYVYCNFLGMGWCPRPQYLDTAMSHTDMMSTLEAEMRSVFASAGDFCTPSGRAGGFGCQILPMNYQKYGHVTYPVIYQDYRDVTARVMADLGSPTFQFLDVWNIGLAMPAEEMAGHSSSYAVNWIIQAIFGGFCSGITEPATGSFANFEGEMCFAAETDFDKCPIYRDNCVLRCTAWECINQVPCLLIATGPPAAPDLVPCGDQDVEVEFPEVGTSAPRSCTRLWCDAELRWMLTALGVALAACVAQKRVHLKDLRSKVMQSIGRDVSSAASSEPRDGSMYTLIPPVRSAKSGKKESMESTMKGRTTQQQKGEGVSQQPAIELVTKKVTAQGGQEDVKAGDTDVATTISAGNSRTQALLVVEDVGAQMGRSGVARTDSENEVLDTAAKLKQAMEEERLRIREKLQSVRSGRSSARLDAASANEERLSTSIKSSSDGSQDGQSSGQGDGSPSSAISESSSTSGPCNVWSAHVSSAGKTYYYNRVDRRSTWVKPEELKNEETRMEGGDVKERLTERSRRTAALTSSSNRHSADDTALDNPWKEMFSKSTGTKYWYNTQTGESTWEKPPLLSRNRSRVDSEINPGIVNGLVLDGDDDSEAATSAARVGSESQLQSDVEHSSGDRLVDGGGMIEEAGGLRVPRNLPKHEANELRHGKDLEAGDSALVPKDVQGSTEGESSDKTAKKKRPNAGNRFPLGFARLIASNHVVAGHLYAKGAIKPWYGFGWGFTWVPWFFMLSGFVLFSAYSRKPRRESIYQYVVRRSVTIYPLYAASLVPAFIISAYKGSLPSWEVLVAQSWLVQAWVPLWTETALQMHCWFLSCMVVYWMCFRFLAQRLVKFSLRTTLVCILALFALPWLLIVVPTAMGESLTWYRAHQFGSTDSPVDIAVVALKFHPACYFHVFIIGMLLARIRVLLNAEASQHRLKFEAMAPLGYLGLLLVFCEEALQPWAFKLFARLSVLLPFQAAILLGLAGLQDAPLPRIAELFKKLEFLGRYSYPTYVFQFICYSIWPEAGHVNIEFFVFTFATAVIASHVVQTPAQQLWKKHAKWRWVVPAFLSIGMGGLSFVNFDGSGGNSLSELPALVVVSDGGAVDVRLEFALDATVINPSMMVDPEDGRLLVAARVHYLSETRSAGEYEGQPATIIDRTWHSDIVMGTSDIAIDSASWRAWPHTGQLQLFSSIELTPWSTLRTPAGHTWNDLCVGAQWVPENRTLIRNIVSGPEDPKLFVGAWAGAASGSLERGSNGTAAVLFSSKAPTELGLCPATPTGASGVDVAWTTEALAQMFLANDVSVTNPYSAELVAGHRLRCGDSTVAEKNWIPLVGGDAASEGLHFVYLPHPHQVAVARRDGACTKVHMSSYEPLERLALDHPTIEIRGSGQAVFVDGTVSAPSLPRPHYLALMHIVETTNRTYSTFAYRFSHEAPFEILQISEQLNLQNMQSPDSGGAPFSFASSLVVHDGVVVVGYGAGDYEARALVMTMEHVDGLFSCSVDPEQVAGRLSITLDMPNVKASSLTGSTETSEASTATLHGLHSATSDFLGGGRNVGMLSATVVAATGGESSGKKKLIDNTASKKLEDFGRAVGQPLVKSTSGGGELEGSYLSMTAYINANETGLIGREINGSRFMDVLGQRLLEANITADLSSSRVASKSTAVVMISGYNMALDAEGFRRLTRARPSTSDLSAYVQRIVSSNPSWYFFDEDSLLDFVATLSLGSGGAATFTSLYETVRYQAENVVGGFVITPATAPLSSEGLAAVQNKGDDVFEPWLLRLLASLNYTVGSEASFRGWMPWVSGTSGAKQWTALIEDLHNKADIGTIIAKLFYTGLDAPLRDSGLNSLRSQGDVDMMVVFLGRVADDESLLVDDDSRVRTLAETYISSNQTYANLVSHITSTYQVGVSEFIGGSNVPLDESGYVALYNLVSTLDNNEKNSQFRAFALRIISAQGWTIEANREAELTGLVEWFNGIRTGIRSYTALYNNLNGKTWVVKG